jgi:hypothetical protein
VAGLSHQSHPLLPRPVDGPSAPLFNCLFRRAFPCSGETDSLFAAKRESIGKALESQHESMPRIAKTARKSQNTLLFSLFAGNSAGTALSPMIPIWQTPCRRAPPASPETPNAEIA